MSTDVRTYDQSARRNESALARAGSLAKSFSQFALSDRIAHWMLRIPLAVLIWAYGAQKFPAVLSDPGSYGVPAVLYVLAAFGEVLGAIGLIAGGAVETWQPKNRWFAVGGDAITRLSAFAISASIAGVMFYFYWGTLTINDPHVMYLGIALYILLRGNRIPISRHIYAPAQTA